MWRFVLGAFLLFWMAFPARAAEVLAPAQVRFARAQGEEVPSFQRHVIPLLGRMGCNGRACHGSFQGQGGLRLSLFGYDFEADHQAFLSGDDPRVDLKAADDSLMLQKATQRVDHKGGKRFAVGSWQHHLLLRWITGGALGVARDAPHFVTLQVEPGEIVFARAEDSAQLRVTAVWSDGTREDVTPLCRFRSNDESIAVITEEGQVIAKGRGDTEVVAFYDNGVVPVQVLLPMSDQTGKRYPAVPTPTRIDELVVAKLRKLGVVPSDLCTDSEFLRRVSLDLTGTLPREEEVLAFLQETSADKRSRKIDELLARPAYAAWWTTRLCDWTGNNDASGPVGGEQGLRREQARQWYQWVHRRVADNVPYDDLVAGIVLATSRKAGQSYEDYCVEMSAYFRKQDPADFSARETMPYFWTRRPLGPAGEKALAFAWSFLGVSLQCAQCHKHPYDQWTKQDFDQFTLFFNSVRYGPSQRDVTNRMKKDLGLIADEDSGGYKRLFVQLAESGKVLPFKELSVPNQSRTTAARRNKNVSGRVITPKLLGGEEVVDGDYSDPRQPVLDWLRQPDNPYFAKAFVNRVWGNYFHVALIDPSDDLNLANPASNPALLDDLTARFIEHNYDMRWLHKTIVSSRTYQLSWRANGSNKQDERNFSRSVLRRLPAEVAHDAIVLATATDEDVQRLHAHPVETRAIGVQSCFSGGREPHQYGVTLFGKPARTINCDCERSSEPSLLQTVYLRNDPEVLKLIDQKNGWVRQVTSTRTDLDATDLIRRAYLRSLSRLPTEQELVTAKEYLSEAGDLRAGLRDLLWVLLNTKEFLINR